MSKILIDVGGYRGESSRAALDPRFGFERVYCFEPVRACYENIVASLKNPRLTVFNAGLLDRTAKLPIFQAGSLGGSVFADAPATGGPTVEGEFIEASQFFREHIRPDDRVWMKLNCEGAECAIMLNLMASGESRKLTEVLLDLDAMKIPSAQEQLARLRAELEHATFSYHYPEEVQREMVTNFGSIRNWLIVTGAIEPGLRPLLRSVVYQIPCATDRTINGYYKIRVLRRLGLRPQASISTKPGSAVNRPRRAA